MFLIAFSGMRKTLEKVFLNLMQKLIKRSL